MFVIGFISGVATVLLWSYWQHKKRQKMVNKIIYSYDQLSAQYYRDYQNREANGMNTSVH